MPDTIPKCPGGCGREAPPPASDEAGEWVIGSDSELGPTALCPECGASQETRQRVLDELRRRNLGRGRQDTADSIVFIRGKAKTLGSLTVADLKWHVAREEEQAAQDDAWTEWFEGRIPRMDEEEV